jgi:hypothetical protein
MILRGQRELLKTFPLLKPLTQIDRRIGARFVYLKKISFVSAVAFSKSPNNFAQSTFRQFVGADSSVGPSSARNSINFSETSRFDKYSKKRSAASGCGPFRTTPTVLGTINVSSVTGSATIGAPSRCAPAISSESVKPIHASPRDTCFTTTELPSTTNGLLLTSARHHACQAASPQCCRNA